MLDGNRPETKHDGQSVYSPSLSEWYRVRVQSVPHVSQANDCALAGGSAPFAAIEVASETVTGLADILEVEW
jgi:hypothetical protein